MSKKEKKLYMQHGKKWDVYVFYKITISEHDTENIIKCHEKLCHYNCVALKRITRKFRFFGTNIYLNMLYGGLND